MRRLALPNQAPNLSPTSTTTWCLLFCLCGSAIGQSKDFDALVDRLATSNPPATIRSRPGDEQASWKKFDSQEGKRVGGSAGLFSRLS
jgi:hypothetical protein